MIHKLELDMIWRNIQTITSCNLNHVLLNKLIKKKQFRCYHQHFRGTHSRNICKKNLIKTLNEQFDDQNMETAIKCWKSIWNFKRRHVPIENVVRWDACSREGRSWEIAFFRTPSANCFVYKSSNCVLSFWIYNIK